MRITASLSWIAVSLALLATEGYTMDAKVTLEHTEISLLSAVESVAPGQPFYAAAHIKLAEHWHTYAKDPGDSGIPTSITWTLPGGFSAGEIEWPPHKSFNEAGLTTYGYDTEVMLPVRITPPHTLPEEIILQARVDALVCKDICIPQTAQVAITLPAGDGKPSAAAAHIEEWRNRKAEKTPRPFDSQTGAASLSLPVVLLFALLGGLILNIMPCVFPVLSLKALKVAKYSASEHSQLKKEAFAYTLGILTCFLTLAGLLIVLQQAGGVIGWGYQFQSPGFVGLMALLMLFIGLNLSGVFELPVLFGKASAEIKSPHSLKGSFLTGLLAALVATPCTAPFMAPAIGFALSQTTDVALLTFVFLGLGLALPFLLLSFFPRLLRFMPKPGPWMQTFKEALAFPMYLTAIWLLWVLGMQAGAMGIIITLGAAVIILFLVWAKRPCKFESVFCKTALWLIVLALLATTAELLERSHLGHTKYASTEKVAAIPYSPEKLEELRSAGKPVFVNATAAWCITCQVNYRIAIATPEVQQAFKDNNVAYMEADWTSRNPEITQLLEQYGFKGVPLYLYYAPGKEAIVLPQLLTPTIILETIAP